MSFLEPSTFQQPYAQIHDISGDVSKGRSIELILSHRKWELSHSLYGNLPSLGHNGSYWLHYGTYWLYYSPYYLYYGPSAIAMAHTASATKTTHFTIHFTSSAPTIAACSRNLYLHQESGHNSSRLLSPKFSLDHRHNTHAFGSREMITAADSLELPLLRTNTLEHRLAGNPNSTLYVLARPRPDDIMPDCENFTFSPSLPRNNEKFFLWEKEIKCPKANRISGIRDVEIEASEATLHPHVAKITPRSIKATLKQLACFRASNFGHYRFYKSTFYRTTGNFHCLNQMGLKLYGAILGRQFYKSILLKKGRCDEVCELWEPSGIENILRYIRFLVEPIVVAYSIHFSPQGEAGTWSPRSTLERFQSHEERPPGRHPVSIVPVYNSFARSSNGLHDSELACLRSKNRRQNALYTETHRISYCWQDLKGTQGSGNVVGNLLCCQSFRSPHMETGASTIEHMLALRWFPGGILSTEDAERGVKVEDCGCSLIVPLLQPPLKSSVFSFLR
ncbi:uncharacterized protein BDR25DRAFT_361122 [Lindgomyces ingoldianus]|uniref:Uncharacterized protein n=1 Tax=Lindgomyces ingoldianus TaxID=673940 RepID=A0ACB6QDG9_9PLEO|nr:uncharacterized protein BDR25DRAFT_361122 [Lindgomyces ingoldianus]KAF2464895.1 hypothetical protein BDR25DRAFT_361122 [Lindgomyces ingoldianus]